MTQELSLVTIAVPHYRQSDFVTHENISFRIFQQDDWFKAVAQTSAEECKATCLPVELVFVYHDRVVLAANNMENESMNVIRNIIKELEVQGHV